MPPTDVSPLGGRDRVDTGPSLVLGEMLMCYSQLDRSTRTGLRRDVWAVDEDVSRVR